MFAGGMLADLHCKDHVAVEFTAHDAKIGKAFEIAGHGKISEPILAQIRKHQSVVFLHFPIDLRSQRERLLKFTRLMQRLGGIAVKIESAGIAHSWERWFTLLEGSVFDLYCAAIVLIGGKDHYYSCGMHHFGLPECAVPASIPIVEAADLMNRFNFHQISEEPTLVSGHTFSLSSDAPIFRLTLKDDESHDTDHPFFNELGVWFLSAA